VKVTVVGSGSIGCAYYALLTQTGHEVRLWSPSGAAKIKFDEGRQLEATGKISGFFQLLTHATAEESVGNADVVIIATPANGFSPVIDALALHAKTSQCFIFSSHSSLAALYLAKRLADRGVFPLICGWSTTVVTARMTSLTSVHVSTIRSVVDVAALPSERSEDAIAACRALFGDRFSLRENMLALTLNNLNPPLHAANMLGNLTRAERGESWPNHDITPAVGAVIQAMDDERLALAREFDLRVRTVQDHYFASFGVQPAKVHEMAELVYNERPELMGPTTLDTRFITEDVPFGLYPLEVLAKMAMVPMPLHTAAIEMFSAICGKDFRVDNPLLAALTDEFSQRALLQRLLTNGYRSGQGDKTKDSD
jgi:opine dehydrogenase